jgi:hypothetical protein
MHCLAGLRPPAPHTAKIVTGASSVKRFANRCMPDLQWIFVGNLRQSVRFPRRRDADLVGDASKAGPAAAVISGDGPRPCQVPPQSDGVIA